MSPYKREEDEEEGDVMGILLTLLRDYQERNLSLNTISNLRRLFLVHTSQLYLEDNPPSEDVDLMQIFTLGWYLSQFIETE